MPSNFEQSTAALAENRLSAEHPNLVPFRRGFVLLDFDEQESKAFGIYRFLIGGMSCMMPIVVRKGDVDGLDILIVSDISLYVPAIDGWINLLSSMGPRLIGELTPVKDRAANGPSNITLRVQDFPFMIKTAKAELSASEYKALCDGVKPAAYDRVRSALACTPIHDMILASPTMSMLVTKAAEVSADFNDKVVDNFGDAFLRCARIRASDLITDSILRKAEAEPEPKIKIITDIGAPEASSLKPSQKRALLKTGQFIIDHRAESEKAMIYASPEALSLRTSPTSGRWDVLSADGRLIPCEIAYAAGDIDYPVVARSSGGDKFHIGLSKEKGQRDGFAILPLNEGTCFFARGETIFAKPSTVPAEEWESKGMPATFDSIATIERVQRKRNPYGVCDAGGESTAIVAVAANGRVERMYMQFAPSNPASLRCECKPVMFSPRFHNIKHNDVAIYIPADAVLFDADAGYKAAFVLGTPSDLEAKVRNETGAKKLTVNLRGQTVEISGAVDHKGMSENDAIKALVMEAGISADQAYGIVRKAVGLRGKPYNCLVKTAAALGPVDTNIINMSQERSQKYYANPDDVVQRASTVAATAKSQEDEFTREMANEVLDMTDFREISGDTIKAMSAAMNESGRQLLRVLVHREEYNERFSDDGTETLEAGCRKAFITNGDTVLVLREKRGKDGYSDNESLMDLLSDDMG